VLARSRATIPSLGDGSVLGSFLRAPGCDFSRAGGSAQSAKALLTPVKLSCLPLPSEPALNYLMV